ncbi:MAG: hypothetical protein VW271_08835 [Chloroflexota bacterium]|jgi:hypothetical protein
MASATDQKQKSAVPELEGFAISRPPLLGYGLIASSVIGSVALLIYFGAWAATDRIENRALASGNVSELQDGEWWEDGLIFACPLH